MAETFAPGPFSMRKAQDEQGRHAGFRTRSSSLHESSRPGNFRARGSRQMRLPTDRLGEAGESCGLGHGGFGEREIANGALRRGFQILVAAFDGSPVQV